MTLPALPMGTIMAACMAAGAVALALPPRARARTGAARAATGLVGAPLLAAGLWQLGWYFPRHPGEGWGLAALASGVCLLGAGAWCVSPRVRARAGTARWVVAASLGALATLYGVTIARL